MFKNVTFPLLNNMHITQKFFMLIAQKVFMLITQKCFMLITLKCFMLIAQKGFMFVTENVPRRLFKSIQKYSYMFTFF